MTSEERRERIASVVAVNHDVRQTPQHAQQIGVATAEHVKIDSARREHRCDFGQEVRPLVTLHAAGISDSAPLTTRWNAAIRRRTRRLDHMHFQSRDREELAMAVEHELRWK